MRNFLFKKIFILSLLGLMFLGLTYFFVVNSNVYALSEDKIIITIDTLGYNENILPKGVVGKSYPVFDCSAVDGNGAVVNDLDIVVYNPNKELVSIKNKRFSTDVVGKYNIVYKFSNGVKEETKQLVVTVVPESEYINPYYIFNENIVTSAKTGEQVVLFDGTYGGGNGEIYVSSELCYEGSYSLDNTKIENYGLYDYFIPVVNGNYIIKYSITDIVGEKITEQKSITVTDSKKPIMNTPFVVSSALVGQEIKFNHTDAIVYADGKQVYVPVKVYVNDTEITSTMTFTAQSKGEYTVKYEAVNVLDDSMASTSLIQIVKIYDLDESKTNSIPYINNYLNLEGLEGTWRESPDDANDRQEGIEYDVFTLQSNGSNKTVSARFATAIPVKYASMRVGFDLPKSEFSTFYMVYTDSVNKDKSITISVKKNTGDSSLLDIYVSGVYKTTVDVYSFCFQIDNKFNVLSNVINENESVDICKITNYDNNKLFDGFKSGFVQLSIIAEDTDSDFAIKLYQICNQNISGSTFDNVIPIFTLPNNFSNFVDYEIGQEYQIKKLKAFDLYSSEVTIKATIIAPDNTKVFDGVVDNNSKIVLSQYGSYKLAYRAIDFNDNMSEIKCVITVIDRTAPIISKISIPNNVKIGETLKLPDAEISDNVTTNVVNWVYVTFDGYQKLNILKKEDADREFTFNKAGIYIIKYGAEDDAGNITVLTYKVVCK